MIDSAFKGVSQATTVVQAVVILAVAVIVLMTFVKTRAAVPVLVTALIGGFVIWVTTGGASWFGDRIEDDADRLTAPAPAELVVNEVGSGPVVV